MRPKVTIAIPTRNRIEFLKTCLDSAATQTFESLEILVSDDKSSDGTQDFVSDRRRDDRRIRLLTDNPSQGIFQNMNHLQRAAVGDYVTFVGDDDLLAPEFIAKLVAPLSANNDIAASFCDHWVVDASGEVLIGATDENSARFGRRDLEGGEVTNPLAAALNQTICIGFSLSRRQAISPLGFQERYGAAADVELGLRLASSGALFYVPERLGYYRRHEGAESARNGVAMSRGLLRLLEDTTLGSEFETLRRCSARRAARAVAINGSRVSRSETLAGLAAFYRNGGRLPDVRLAGAALSAVLPDAIRKALSGFSRGS